MQGGLSNPNSRKHFTHAKELVFNRISIIKDWFSLENSNKTIRTTNLSKTKLYQTLTNQTQNNGKNVE